MKISFFIIALACSLTLEAQDPSSGAVRNIYDMLRNVPGVEISLSTGAKSQQQVYIRDSRNLKGKIPATFVVDKVIYDGDVSLINPIDVADITVLKDAAAAAAYGSRAFGGVLIHQVPILLKG